MEVTAQQLWAIALATIPVAADRSPEVFGCWQQLSSEYDLALLFTLIPST
jgi:hypothetical protein